MFSSALYRIFHCGKKKPDDKLVLSIKTTHEANYGFYRVCGISDNMIAILQRNFEKRKVIPSLEIINIDTGLVIKKTDRDDIEGIGLISFDGENIIIAEEVGGNLVRWDINTDTGQTLIKNLSCMRFEILSKHEFIRLIDNEVWLFDTDKKTKRMLFNIEEACNGSAIIIRDKYIIAFASHLIRSTIFIYDLTTESLNNFKVDGLVCGIDATDSIIAIINIQEEHNYKIRFFNYNGTEIYQLKSTYSLDHICALPTGEFYVFQKTYPGPLCMRIDPRLRKPIIKEEKIDISISAIKYDLWSHKLICQLESRDIACLDIGLKEKYKKALNNSDFGKKVSLDVQGVVLNYCGIFANRRAPVLDSAATLHYPVSKKG